MVDYSSGGSSQAVPEQNRRTMNPEPQAAVHDEVSQSEESIFIPQARI